MVRAVSYTHLVFVDLFPVFCLNVPRLVGIAKPHEFFCPIINVLWILIETGKGVTPLPAVQKPAHRASVYIVYTEDRYADGVAFEDADAQLEVLLFVPGLFPLESGELDVAIRYEGFNGFGFDFVHVVLLIWGVYCEVSAELKWQAQMEALNNTYFSTNMP